MDINLLVINVGNTRVAVAPFIAGEIRDVARLPVADKPAIDAAVRAAWATLASTESPAVAGASVNPATLEAIEHAVTQITGKKVEWVGRDLDLPMKVLTDPPTDTGVDRVCNMAAAFEQMEKACVVVDAGTAITFSACNQKGEFLGGAIAPGAQMQLAALHEHTAKLPRVDLTTPQGVFGRSTAEAIRHGVYFGIRGMVKELLENYATELGSWPELICTGGDAPALFDNWELVHAISPDLTMYGIALAYTNHHIKHGT
ncbi:MAG TPA: type III pantothenate kinase [Tepidisphaeraceae bacterium]|nr:type III pantothenate kinase [Tepidisphaeraceae bacterium]